MMRPLSRIQSRCGYILLPVVLLLGLLALVAFFLGHEGGIGRYLTLQRAEPEQALYVAEAGLQYATWQVQQANCVNYSDIGATPFGDHSFSATITPHSGSPVDITATGSLSGGVSRALTRSMRALETPVTVILQPDGAGLEDTWIYQWKKTWNYGADTTIQVDTEFFDSIMRTLMKFDLSSIASSVKVLGATLELYQMSPSVNGGPVGVHRMNMPWDEGIKSGGLGPGATWNESATGVPWTALGGDGDFDPEPVTVTNVPMGAIGWYAWDITDLVSDWVTGISPNHGLMLRMQQGGKSAYFYSSDYSNEALRPRLTITFACECGSGASQAVTLQPGTEGMDSYVQNKNNDTNNGALVDLAIQDTWDLNNSHISLLTFDLSGVPSGVFVTSAQLSLYAHAVNTGIGGTDITVHRTLAPWTEEGVTYQFSDGSTPWTWPDNFEAVPQSATTFFKDNLGWYTWDLTDLANQWFSGVSPNYGIMLHGSPLTYFVEFHSSEYTDPALRPKLTINYTCPCGVDCSGGALDPLDVLFVVGDATSLASKDAGRKTLMESWGYNVTLIDDGDSQANFDSAAAAADVVYVSGTIEGGTLGDKLTGSLTGIVNEFYGKLDNFGFCSTTGTFISSADTFTKTDPGHFITEPFSGDPAVVFSTPLSMSVPFGTLAPDLQNVGEVSGQLALVTLDTGATRWDNNPAPARRVHLPYSSAEATNLTGDGETILQRALRWAGGEGAGSGGIAPATVTLNPVRDSWIDPNNVSANYGTDTTMDTGADISLNPFRSMVEFDVSVIPAGTTVSSATLRLYVESEFGNIDANISLHQITTGWDENTVTWSSFGSAFDPTPLANPLLVWSSGWKEWDVPTGLIHEWLDGVTDNYGFLLDYQGAKKNHTFNFATKDHGDPAVHPQLVIEYTEP